MGELSPAVARAKSLVRLGWRGLLCRLGEHAWGMALLGLGSRSVGWECRRCGLLSTRPTWQM